MGLDYLPCRNVSSFYDPVEEEYLTDPFVLFTLAYDECQEIRAQDWTRYCMVCVRPPPPEILPSSTYASSEVDEGERRAVFFFFITILVLACFLFICLYNIQQWRHYSSSAQNPSSSGTIFSRPRRISIRSRRQADGDVEAGREGQSLEDLMTIDEILKLPKVIYQDDNARSRGAKKKKKRKLAAVKAKKQNETDSEKPSSKKAKPDSEKSSSSLKKKKTAKKGKKASATRKSDAQTEENDDNPSPAVETSSKSKPKVKDKKKKPTKKLKTKKKQTSQYFAGTCSICLEDFQNGDTLRELPQCHHLFHTECLIPWLSENHKRCPMCTVPVLDVPKKEKKSSNDRSG